MNTYLLGLIAKWAGILCLSVSGLFNSGSLFSEEKIEVDNVNQTKNSAAGVTEVAYNTEKTYNSKLPSNITITKVKGQNGLAYTDSSNNTVETLTEPVDEVLEIGTGDYGEYVGKMTGYGADCDGCSSTGTLSCQTREGESWSLVNDGEFYNDSEYGSVRILAAALDKFPCGTIIKVQNTGLGDFTAIVMDTGSAMRNAWSNGTILMDLAFKSESSDGVHNATGSNIKYSVQRWGW